MGRGKARMKLPPFDARLIATRHASQNIKFLMGRAPGMARGHPERLGPTRGTADVGAALGLPPAEVFLYAFELLELDGHAVREPWSDRRWKPARLLRGAGHGVQLSDQHGKALTATRCSATPAPSGAGGRRRRAPRPANRSGVRPIGSKAQNWDAPRPGSSSRANPC